MKNNRTKYDDNDVMSGDRQNSGLIVRILTDAASLSDSFDDLQSVSTAPRCDAGSGSARAKTVDDCGDGLGLRSRPALLRQHIEGFMDARAGRILAPALLDRRFQIVGLRRAHCRPAIRLATPIR